MGKTIKHLNLISAKEKMNPDNKFEQLQFVCRGCTMMQYRKDIWHGWNGSMVGDPLNSSIDNSYFTLEEEPDNAYDPNAIQVVCRGEFFGTAGYVGKEYTAQVKKVLDECTAYRIDVLNNDEIGQKEVTLVLSWKGK